MFHVLLVEDNPGDVELIKEGFSEYQTEANSKDTQIYIVSDGVEALSFLRKENEYSDSPTPDLVLLDINLPKKNGHEVLTDIRADSLLKYLPVVVLTTSDQDRDISESYERNANAFVSKPGNASDFINVVKQIQSFWLNTAQLPSK